MAGTDKKVVGSLERTWSIERTHSQEMERRASADGAMPFGGASAQGTMMTFGDAAGVPADPPPQVFRSGSQETTFSTGSLPSMRQPSPLGSFEDPSTRRLLANLIITLNHSFADYDFSSLKPEEFTPERQDHVYRMVNARISSREDGAADALCHELWAALDTVIDLKQDCDIYSYLPDLEADVFSSGKLWSLNFFFHNKRLHRIVFLALWVKSPDDSSSATSVDEGSDEFLDEMDME